MNTRRALWAAMLAIFLFVSLGCGVMQCGASVMGDVTNTNQEADDGLDMFCLGGFLVLCIVGGVMGLGMAAGGGGA